MKYDLTIDLQVPYRDAVPAVKQALQDQGFGVLTEIDVRATLQDKLGEDIEDYLILGACNPQLAHRALEVERLIGLLLPCNVVVRADGPDRTVVSALDPQMMVTLPDRTDLQPVAEEAARRLRAALADLAGS